MLGSPNLLAQRLWYIDIIWCFMLSSVCGFAVWHTANKDKIKCKMQNTNRNMSPWTERKKKTTRKKNEQNYMKPQKYCHVLLMWLVQSSFPSLVYRIMCSFVFAHKMFSGRKYAHMSRKLWECIQVQMAGLLFSMFIYFTNAP